MSGPQFIHVEGYARKAAGDKTTTASGAIGEAIRQEGYCSHVTSPEPPRFVHGSENGLRELNSEIHRQADAAKDAQGRKMRSDQTILIAGVASYPKPTAAMTEADKAELEDWIKATNAFLYKEFRGNFKSALLHMDEEYPQIHFYVADTNDVMKTKDLHPARATGAGKNKKEGVAALRGFQDRYNEQVGQRFGMTRVGPKRERLSRPDWLEKKRQADELAKKLKELEALELKKVKAIADADEAKALAVIERAALVEEKAKVQHQLQILVNAAERYTATETKLREAGVKVPRKSFELQQADNLIAAATKPAPGREAKLGEKSISVSRPKHP